MINKKVKTPFDALTALYDEGYRKVVMVAGSDRIAEYDLRLNKYNGKESTHGLYNFKDGIKIFQQVKEIQMLKVLKVLLALNNVALLQTMTLLNSLKVFRLL
jgi:hypothetical protein